MLEKDSQHCARATQRFNFVDVVRLASETLGAHQFAPVRKLTLIMLRVVDLAVAPAGNSSSGASELAGRAGDLVEHPVRRVGVCARGA